MVRMRDLVRGDPAVPARTPEPSSSPAHLRMSSLASQMRADAAAGGAEIQPPAESVEANEAGDAAVDAAPSEPRDRRGRRAYRHMLGGFAVVFLLVSAIAGLAAWRMGWPGWGEAPRGSEPRPPEDRAAAADVPAPTARLDSRAVPAASPVPVPVAGLPRVEVPAGPESTATPSAPPPSQTSSAPVTAPAATVAASDAARESAVKEPAAIAQGPRFAVEFGPFLTGAEAERTERQVTQAGYPTVRFRQQTGAALYAVLIERPPGPRQAQVLVETLREHGIQEPVVPDGGDALNVRVGEPLLLRAAVQLAETLRAKGHPVRLAAQPGEAQTFVIRHGNFASRDEAEARSVELARLGLPNSVVRAK